ncbi:hypothetical protein B1812_15705 [Methylocystis bryophila]|uniref:Metal-binding protein n=1 Tax=Methylocystis bryophila TaxID=655015 RepID=A0A1W6N1K7_9HYPH|nr:hypothetical protein B1812_15705 [Methylocystis bryophila]
MVKQKENSTSDRRADAPPLSRPLAVASVPAEGLEIVIRANEPECAALARLNALPGVLWLEAPLRITRIGRDGLKVVGVLRAEVRQTCVVTLEEFDAVIEEPVSVRFAPPKAEEGAAHGRRETLTADDVMGLDDDDGADPLVGGHIDLGALAGEFLTLGLDPHPRKPGARFEEPAPAIPDDNPFAAVLKRGADTDDA